MARTHCVIYATVSTTGKPCIVFVDPTKRTVSARPKPNKEDGAKDGDTPASGHKGDKVDAHLEAAIPIADQSIDDYILG